MNNIFKNLALIAAGIVVSIAGAGKMAQAATFIEKDDAGDLIQDAQSLIGLDIDRIEGTLHDTGDTDVYQLQFNLNGRLNIQARNEMEFVIRDLGGNLLHWNPPLYDHLGHALKFIEGTQDYEVAAGEFYYLATATLGGQRGDGFLQVVTPYSISLKLKSQESSSIQSVPEPGIAVALGFLSLGGILARKVNTPKS